MSVKRAKDYHAVKADSGRIQGIRKFRLEIKGCFADVVYSNS